MCKSDIEKKNHEQTIKEIEELTYRWESVANNWSSHPTSSAIMVCAEQIRTIIYRNKTETDDGKETENR